MIALCYHVIRERVHHFGVSGHAFFLMWDTAESNFSIYLMLPVCSLQFARSIRYQYIITHNHDIFIPASFFFFFFYLHIEQPNNVFLKNAGSAGIVDHLSIYLRILNNWTITAGSPESLGQQRDGRRSGCSRSFGFVAVWIPATPTHSPSSRFPLEHVK